MKPFEPAGTQVWLAMRRAQRAVERLAARGIEASGVGLSDFAVLELILREGPQPVNELGRRVGLTSGAITTAIDRLAGLRLVVRAAHPTDRRARIVRLTARGREHASRLMVCHKTVIDTVASRLSKLERATLVELLTKLGRAAAPGGELQPSGR